MNGRERRLVKDDGAREPPDEGWLREGENKQHVQSPLAAAAAAAVRVAVGVTAAVRNYGHL